jgi:hypothetical protein
MDFKKRCWAGSLPMPLTMRRATVTTLLQGLGFEKVEVD